MIKHCLDILKGFLGPGQCVRKTTDAKRKLQNSYYYDVSKVKVYNKCAIFQKTELLFFLKTDSGLDVLHTTDTLPP